MMRVIFYHVGKGDCSLVLLPNGDAMLIDCYKADKVADGEVTQTETVLDKLEKHILEHREDIGHSDQALGEAATKERKKERKVPIAVLVVTHADRDHILSSAELKERFDIRCLIDSGREYGEPSDAQADYLKFREEMRGAKKYASFARARENIWPTSGAVIDVLCPNRDIDAFEDNNNQCLVLKVAYQGKSFLFTGDSPLPDWTDDRIGVLTLHGDKVSSYVLNVSHHGSRTFFTPPGRRPEGQPEFGKDEYDTRALEIISPTLSFITCSDDEGADHPDQIALGLYQEMTNAGRASHVILSRESRHLHHAVDIDGSLYIRTSRSRCNSSNPIGILSAGPYLTGIVSSQTGYLHESGIWVSKAPLASAEDIKFTVQAKGVWRKPISFDWWVLNNGQGGHSFHREFYTMDSKDRKRQSTWSRTLTYEGAHLMQCQAYTEDLIDWANWCVLVCQQDSLPYALGWLEIFRGCIDRSKINRYA